MDLQEQIQKLKNKLELAGYGDISGLLELCMNKNLVFKIGIIGNYSTGKSSIINSLTGHQLLKSSVIPAESVITVKSGIEDAIILINGEMVSLDKMDELLEQEPHIEVLCSSEILEGKEIIEFPGLISKRSLENIQVMKDLYMCDAAILVISADHMLSETECSFIENFSKYADKNRLFVLFNKLDLIEKDDITRVYEYASKQMNLRFPDVKWSFLQKDLLPHNKDNISGIDEVKNVIKKWSSENKQLINENSLDNIKEYIKELLTEELENLKILSSLDDEQRKLEVEQTIQKKTLEKIRLENILLEFIGKSSQTLEKIDTYLRDVFDKMGKSIFHKFDIVEDKYTWYKEELPKIWNNDLKIVASRVDEHIIEIIGKDVEWLNGQSVVCAEANLTIANLLNEQLENNYQGKTYGKAKKYIPLGIGGSIVVGFCLFRIVGASVCLGGGLLFGYCLNYLEQLQSKEIKDSISVDIDRVAVSSRKMAEKEIKNIYSEIIDRYNNSIAEYLEKKYVVTSETKDFSLRIADIEQIIGLL